MDGRKDSDIPVTERTRVGAAVAAAAAAAAAAATSAAAAAAAVDCPLESFKQFLLIKQFYGKTGEFFLC